FPTASINEVAQSKKALRMNRYAALLQRKAEVQASLAAVREELKNAQNRLAQFESTPVPLPDLTQKMEADPNIATRLAVFRQRAKWVEDHVRQSSNPYGPDYARLARQRDAAAADVEAQKQQFVRAVEADFRNAQRAGYQGAVEKAVAEGQRLEALAKATGDELPTFKDLAAEDEATQKKMAERIQQQDDITRYREQLARIESSLL